MHAILNNLLKLQALHFDNHGVQNQAQVEELRRVIPQPFLGHYERLQARGKKGVAFVRNQVCTGCHMRLPIGTITLLMRDEDVQLCDSCGRYLVLAEEPKAPTPVTVPEAEAAPATSAPAKRARKPRKPRAVVETAG
jgi:predicted  nucleic acid-binding Zn-ribbon protein